MNLLVIFSLVFLVPRSISLPVEDPPWDQVWVMIDDSQMQNLDTKAINNIENVVTFTLYTKNNPEDGFLVEPTKISLKDSGFDPHKETKFVTHGWMSNRDSDTCQSIKDAYLQFQDVNVFIVDWKEPAANMFYVPAARNTKEVGQYIARFLDMLYEIDTDPEKVHLIGHSLGAHVSGFAGEHSSRKVGRITGLDPAGPMFDGINLIGGRLSKNQANFVDVIHTTAGTVGMLEPIGHADFYPNGGFLPQPGCDDIIQRGCSHGRSWKYFAESINPDSLFKSEDCASFENFKRGACKGEKQIMGEYVNQSIKGTFFLNTNDKPKFSKV